MRLNLNKIIITKIAQFMDKLFPRFFNGRRVTKGNNTKTKTFANLEKLIENHFQEHSVENHICRGTLSKALYLLNTNKKPVRILETGSSAWGTNSSLLFDSFVSNFGGLFETVDIRILPSVTLFDKCSPNTFLYCDDSVTFLKKWSANNIDITIDLLYLDSWDVAWSNPTPSALHGLAEFLAVSNHFKKGSLLLIDDTPADLTYFTAAQNDIDDFLKYKSNTGLLPGKGTLIREILQNSGRASEIRHEYQSLWLFDK